MSTLSTTNLKHPSSGSNNIVLDSSGNTRVTAITDSAGANSSTPAAIAAEQARQAIRDRYSAMQGAIDAAATPDAIKAALAD